MVATSSRSSRRRLATIRVIAIVMAVSAIGFGLFTVIFGIVGPDQEPHAFHNAVVASLLVILSAPATVAVARFPAAAHEALVVLAVLAAAGLTTMALSLTIDPFTLPFVGAIALLRALAPNHGDLLPGGRPSPILLVLVMAAAPLVVYAIGQAELQRTDSTSAHDAFFHWVETSFYAITALGLGLLAALRPVVHRLAAWTAGLALCVLGAASLQFGGHASSLPAPWGWAALVGGAAFIAAAEWEARRLRGASAQKRQKHARAILGTDALTRDQYALRLVLSEPGMVRAGVRGARNSPVEQPRRGV